MPAQTPQAGSQQTPGITSSNPVPDEPEEPKQHAHLMVLTGQGDTYAVLIDAATIRWTTYGGQIPGFIINDYMEEQEYEEDQRDLAISELTADPQSSTQQNDRMLAVTMGTKWRTGNRYSKFHLDVNEINKFCEENNLILDDETYSGAIY